MTIRQSAKRKKRYDTKILRKIPGHAVFFHNSEYLIFIFILMLLAAFGVTNPIMDIIDRFWQYLNP